MASYVILCAGQSNSLGRGQGTFPGYTPNSSVKMWDPNVGFVTYTPGTASSVQAIATITGQWGAEAEYARQFRVSNPSDKLYIVKIGYDSTSLAVGALTGNWAPSTSGGLFEVMESQTTNALANIVASGETPIIKFLWWMQGEADATDSAMANAYQANLTAFIAAARSRWSIPTQRIIVGRIARNSETWTYQALVTDAQEAVVAADPTLTLINTDDCALDDDGLAHYGPIGLTLLGERLWEADHGTYTFTEVVNGTERVVNGTFDSGIDNWIGTGISWSAGKIAQAPVASTTFETWIAGLVPGDEYTLSLDAEDAGSSGLGQYYISIKRGNGVDVVGNYLASSPFTLSFIAPLTSLKVYFNRIIGDSVINFDNVSVLNEPDPVIPPPPLWTIIEPSGAIWSLIPISS